MDENIITLSSDEENESPNSSSPVKKTSVLTNNLEISKCLSLLKEKLRKNIVSVKSVRKNKNQVEIQVVKKKKNETDEEPESPEVVDLEEYGDKSCENDVLPDDKEGDDAEENHSDTSSLVDAEEILPFEPPSLKNDSNCPMIEAEAPGETSATAKDDVDVSNKAATVEEPESSLAADAEAATAGNDATTTERNEIIEDGPIPDEIVNVFTEFVDYCGSLEENEKDREKLTEKLKKHFNNCDRDYILSEEFMILITKFRWKTEKNNFYLMAKGVTDELKLHKGVQKKEKAPVEREEAKSNEESRSLHQQKRLKKIEKIINKLNQLRSAIQEIEKEEVDFSDEENSVYLKLHRFRERYYVVYKKLCKYTNNPSLHRILNRKFHFTESDYPAVNKCIEKWLNATQRFPDFTDIVKVLEGQKTELNLPSDKHSIRRLAIDIFQKLGNVLQIQRQYELWNSLSVFLDDATDPIPNDPDLERILDSNYKERMRKEEEIYQYYVERQEKEKLEPKEISEDEAYFSPESGNEEEEEIIKIEKYLADRLIDTRQSNPAVTENQASDEVASKEADALSKKKESKNNFRNCKSLKWRTDKGRTSKSEDSDTSLDAERNRLKEGKGEGSDNPELIVLEPDNPMHETRADPPPSHVDSSKKRGFQFKKENSSKRRKGMDDLVRLRGQKESKNPPIFDVGFCQTVTNFRERRVVFRDLTNLNRLMKKGGVRDEMAGLLMPSLLFSRDPVKKETLWKRRLKMNVKEVKPRNEKCGLNEEEKRSEKRRSSSRRGSEEKESKGNGDRGKEEEDLRSQRNGEEEDDRDKGDENRRNGKMEDEKEEHEEDDDEEEEESPEGGEHSSDTKKTETETLIKGESCRVEETEQEDKEAEEKEARGKVYEDYEKEEEEEECGNKCKDSDDVEEFEDLKNSLEPICVLKEGDSCDIIEVTSENVVMVGFEKEKREHWKFKGKERFKTGGSTKRRFRGGGGGGGGKEGGRGGGGGRKEGRRVESRGEKRFPMTTEWTPPAETSQSKPRKMSASDEERVKRFLMHSPSSISITPPKKLTLAKPPSQSALQALATLRNLKGISATIVKGKPKGKDEGTGGEEERSKRPAHQTNPSQSKRRRGNVPVISNVESGSSSGGSTLTPKIVTVQGNVSGFESLWPETRNNGNKKPDSSSIRISEVWGSLPETIAQGSPSTFPPAKGGCSSRKRNPGTSNQVAKKKKNTKKVVEYVVLD